MRIYLHTSILFLFALLFIPRTVLGNEATAEERFIAANQAYQDQRFVEAAKGYEALLEINDHNGHVFFNLGNAYFRLNDLGRAILNYERSRIFMPRDADLDFNLRYAREQLKDIVTTQEGFIEMIFFWLDGFSLTELLWAFVVFHVLFWAVLLLRLFARSDWSFYLLVAALSLWVITGTSFGVKWHNQNHDDRSVVVAEEVAVLAGPDTNNTILFKLHAGTVVHSERFEDGWTLINLPDKKRGWIRSNAIESVSLHRRNGQTG